MPQSDRERIIEFLLEYMTGCGDCFHRDKSTSESDLSHALWEEFDFSDLKGEEHDAKYREEAGRLAKWVENMIDDGLKLGMPLKQIMRYLLVMFIDPPSDAVMDMLKDFEEESGSGI